VFRLPLRQFEIRLAPLNDGLPRRRAVLLTPEFEDVALEVTQHWQTRERLSFR
jgi:hypothetical protein